MMGMRTPETCWAVFERQAINLRNCCIWLVDSFECMKMHGLPKPKFTVSWSVVLINNVGCYRMPTVRSSSQHSFTCGWYIYVQISPDEENVKKKKIETQVSHLEKQRQKIIFLTFCLDISDYLSMWAMDLPGDTIPITNKINFSSWR